MKRHAHRRKGSRGWRDGQRAPAGQGGAPVTDRRIVPVDDGPLRKRAAGECQRAMAKLEGARDELRRFEQEDRPGFGRWMAANFGALLTEIRENARLIDEKRLLILEVETEMALTGHNNPRKAYAAVMKYRQAAAEEDEAFAGGKEGDAGDDWEADEDGFEDMGAEIPEAERQELFEDFARAVLGVNPRRLGKAEYERLFAEFEGEMFGNARGAKPAREEAPRAKNAAEGGVEGRIKEVYRVLVRRLHPDLRADGDATVSAMWHEVQEAYEAGNLDRLETLLALTEMERDTNGGQATLSQMREALADFNRALRAIQRSVREAKRDPAWGFSRNPYHGQMEKRIRREMEEVVLDQRSTLEDAERVIEDWSRGWRAPLKKPAKPKGGRGKANPPGPVQTEFFAFP